MRKGKIKLLRKGFRSIVERVAGGEVLPPALHEGDQLFNSLVEEVRSGEGHTVQEARPRPQNVPETLAKAGAL